MASKEEIKNIEVKMKAVCTDAIIQFAVGVIMLLIGCLGLRESIPKGQIVFFSINIIQLSMGLFFIVRAAIKSIEREKLTETLIVLKGTE